MAHKPEKLLTDIVAAAEAVTAFLVGRSRADYDTDLLLRSGVERQLEILGEALRRLERIDPASAQRISEYRRVIAFRNIIVHAYDTIDHDIVWQAVEDKLPLLLEEARQLLHEHQP